MLEQSKKPMVRAYILGIMTFAISCVPQTQANASAGPAQTKLEARIADLKAKTAVLAAAARARLDSLSPQQRLTAPRRSGECVALSLSSRTAPTVRR
jgi:hypothetical protein